MTNNFTIQPTRVTTGIYSGDSTDNKPIAHGLGRVPKYILIRDITVDYFDFVIYSSQATIFRISEFHYAVTAMDAINFYVGNVAEYTKSANLNTHDYVWVATG